MPRSHPPTLLTRVRRTLREECGIGTRARVLVAVSGGGDSLALLHALACLSKKVGLELFAHGIDHGLRPEAPAELLLARQLAERCAVPFSQSRLEMRSGSNLQARAREARYAALRRAAYQVGAEFIATGHHADDRAETVLMRLLRGAGPRGLCVLPARSDALLRPMIRARRSDVLLHLARHSIVHAEDPSNQDRRFLRVRVRHEVIPLLQSLSPGVVDHLNSLADQLGDEPPALLVDTQGRQVMLGRKQAGQLQRARRLGLAGVLVRLAGGREAMLDPATGQPVLRSERRSAAPAPGRALDRASERRRRDA